MTRETRTQTPRRAFRTGRWEEGNRALPEECPVALVYNGTTQAVMMATPDALADFAVGFSLTEGIVAAPEEISELEVVDHAGGIELRMWLADRAAEAFEARRRSMTGPIGCGLCGLDSLSEAMRPVTRIPGGMLALTPADVAAAMKGLTRRQALHDATRAAHAAGFFVPGQGVVTAREDVGRHNALDKLAGAMARAGIAAGDGALVMTSRVSIDLVQKAAVIGIPALIAASAPTAEAVRQAEAAGLTLIGLARGEDFEVFTKPERFDQRKPADVA